MNGLPFLLERVNKKWEIIPLLCNALTSLKVFTVFIIFLLFSLLEFSILKWLVT
jgi:hypothetical protein